MVTCIYTYLYIFLYVAISTWFASSLRQRWVHADASNSDSLLHGTFSSCMSVTSNSQKLLSHKPPTIYLIVQFQYTCGAVSQSVRLHRCVWLFATPWAAVCQSSLSITNFRSLLKLMSIELVMPSNHLIPFSSCLQSSPASGSFPMSQFFASGGQSIGVSASASVLPMNIQDWFPVGLTGLISLQSKGLSRVSFNTTVKKHWKRP